MGAMYRLPFTKRADTALRTVSRDIALHLRERLADLAQDPYAQRPNVTRLQNRPAYRLRVGDWRVIYEIAEDRLIILVLNVGPRGKVYR
ncbi:MAG: type II toxin-antitoxin system RelE/ParE family toxin [Chloroflexota bacterium]